MLDWEICTLGDPLADLGMLQVYWTGPGDDPSAWGGSATTAEGFLDRADMVDGTRRVSGRDISSCRSTFRSPTGSWRASCKACTTATSAVRSDRAIPPSSNRSSPRSTAPPHEPRSVWRRCMTDPYMLHEPLPSLDIAGDGRDADRVDRCQRCSRRSDEDVQDEGGYDRWQRSTAIPSSITGLAGRRWSSARESTFDWCGPTSSSPRAGLPGSRCVDAQRSRTRFAMAKVRRCWSALAVELGVQQMVALGAYPFATPHTRDPDCRAVHPRQTSSPTSLTSRTPSTFPRAWVRCSSTRSPKGMPALGIWAQVPHYVSALSYPAATLALLTGLHDVAGLVVDAAGIRQETIIQRQRLDQLVASNDEHRSMVNQLEAALRPGPATDRSSRNR